MEVKIVTEKELESYLDRILTGNPVILPSSERGIIKKLTLALLPVRRNGSLIVAWDYKNNKTVILAKTRLLKKEKKRGKLVYLVDLIVGG